MQIPYKRTYFPGSRRAIIVHYGGKIFAAVAAAAANWTGGGGFADKGLIAGGICDKIRHELLRISGLLFTFDILSIYILGKAGSFLELNKKNSKRILLLIACAVVLYWGLNNLSTLGGVLSSFFSLLAPLLIGVAIAYVMNLLLRAIEGLWDRALKKAPELWRVKLKRPICLTLTILLFLGIIFAIIFILIPRLEDAGTTLVANVPSYITQIQVWWDNLSAFADEHGVNLPELSMNADDATKFVTKLLTSNGGNVVNTTINITTSILGALVNVLLALVFSVYMLAQKEKLISQARRLLLAILPKKAGARTMHILKITNNAFSSFVTGQVTEAFILGTLCCLGMLILRLPYALPVSVIISFTSLIPIFGAWIGAATGAFLIVFVSPIKALTFLIFLLILQQVEGNLIYPKVVGKSVGLPGLWVLAAVTIGGGMFGVLGMLLGVPVCSVIYVLVQDFLRAQPAEEPGQEIQ